MNSERISPFWVNGYQPFSAPLCYEKGEHRKGDTTEAAHALVKERAVFHQVVGTMVCHHRKDGDDLQCATTQWRQMD